MKTLTDLDAASVNLTPVSRTVAQLVAIKAPKKRPATKRAGTEKRVYKSARIA